MAEVLIKANLKEGDTISVGFNSAKSEIKIKDPEEENRASGNNGYSELKRKGCQI